MKRKWWQSLAIAMILMYFKLSLSDYVKHTVMWRKVGLVHRRTCTVWWAKPNAQNIHWSFVYCNVVGESQNSNDANTTKMNGFFSTPVNKLHRNQYCEALKYSKYFISSLLAGTSSICCSLSIVWARASQILILAFS